MLRDLAEYIHILEVNNSFVILELQVNLYVKGFCLDTYDLRVLLYPDILYIAYLQSDFPMKLLRFYRVKASKPRRVSVALQPCP